MGNFVYALIILALIIIFTAVNSVIICNICDDITALIEENCVEVACGVWEDNRKYISLFVRDTEIDLVDTAIRQINTQNPDGKNFFIEAVNEVRRSESIYWDCIF